MIKYSQIFRQKLKVARYSESTIKTYISTLASFFKANDDVPVEDVEKSSLEGICTLK